MRRLQALQVDVNQIEMQYDCRTTLMTKEEYFAKLERAEKQIEQGKYTTFESAEALDEYIRSL